jgi:D-serine deaminase-like pyridoxal phosphate-dependent protein
MDIRDLDTPCAVVDLDVLEANARTMAERASSLGVRLRPHVKTHKCPEAARIQVQDHFGGITVSTLAEAERFGREGFRDITYAVPIAPGKIGRAAGIGSALDSLILLVDRTGTLDDLENFARTHGTRFPVFLKVDCGYHRSGVDPEGEDCIALAWRCAESSFLEFRGILTHAGHAYHCHGREEVRTVAEQERDVMVALAGRLGEAGIAVPEISIGSTPTLAVAEDLTGVTEVRPGNYSFFDAFQVAIGSCGIDDVAFSVLAGVIATYPERGTAVVDAGSLALSPDPGAVHIDPACGFGIPVGFPGEADLTGMRIVSLSQEHGVLAGYDRIVRESMRAGMKVRILPNHACLAASNFQRYHVVRGGKVVDTWTPVRGW